LNKNNWIDVLIQWKKDNKIPWIEYKNHQIGFPEKRKIIKEITELELNWNEQMPSLIQLPKEIARMTQLTRLNLYGHKLIELPKEIGELVSLKELDIGANCLEDLPPEILKLTNLIELNLYGNKKLTLTEKQKNWILSLEKKGCNIQVDNFSNLTPLPSNLHF